MVRGMNHLVDQIAMGYWPEVGYLLGVFSYRFFLYNKRGITSHFTPYSIIFLSIYIDCSQIALVLIYSI